MSYQEVAVKLLNTQVGHVDVISDTCFAGGAFSIFQDYSKNKPLARFNLLTASDARNCSFSDKEVPGAEHQVYGGALIAALNQVTLDANGDGFVSSDEFDDQLVQASLSACKAGDDYATNQNPKQVKPNGMTGAINGAVQFQSAPDPNNPGFTILPFALILFGEIGSFTDAQGNAPACLHSRSSTGIWLVGDSTDVPDPNPNGIGYGPLVTYMFTNPPANQAPISGTPQGGPVGPK